ncbi:glycosyltransferase family 2 protein [Acidobacteria bacterium AH-259-L09]|nr:glycosyltransferase family 2 protein [Acidobacteria bacterium AH-259-L09]
MSTSELTVIIPTYNRKDLLKNCLKSLGRQSAPCRVLVVDNGSTDLSWEMLEEDKHDFPPDLHYLRLGANLGFARAVNEGIKASSTEFIALLNDDTEADEHWVEVGLEALIKFSDYSFFASKVINYNRRTVIDCAGDCYDQKGIPKKRGFGEAVDKFSRNEPVLAASAAAAFYRRRLFDDIGLFDEDFWMYLEDVDFSLRAQLCGHRCLYLSDAIVYHIEAASDPDRKLFQAHWPTFGGSKDELSVVSCELSAETDKCSSTSDQLSEAQPYYSRQRVYWITRNRWLLMLTYQPLRHLPWLVYGWARSALSHLLKIGFPGCFLAGLSAGILNTHQALRKRAAMRRVISMRMFCRLMKECIGSQLRP